MAGQAEIVEVARGVLDEPRCPGQTAGRDGDVGLVAVGGGGQEVEPTGEWVEHGMTVQATALAGEIDAPRVARSEVSSYASARSPRAKMDDPNVTMTAGDDVVSAVLRAGDRFVAELLGVRRR